MGRVTGALEVPRGPDVKHRIRVPASWLAAGAEVELELPRNLACAACEGGGCDACDRSGAISVRGRKEPVELLTVTLPTRADDLEGTGSGRTLVLRVPDRGGLSTIPSEPRGLLFLHISTSHEPDPTVRRIEVVAPPEEDLPKPAIAALPPRSRAVLWVAILVLIWMAFLIWLRVTGRG